MKIAVKLGQLFFILSLFSFNASSQELNCQVSVASQKIQTTDKSVFQTLQTSIFEFMNNRKWTNYSYKMEERIECSILINITDWNNADEFKATLQVQARRPVYKSSYNTVLLNYMDKDFQFNYLESEPLDFQINSHTSNLTSVLAYYAYLIIGLDFDSYTIYGGTPFFEKAQLIVNNAQNAREAGWKAYENQKNRYWIIENLLNSSHNALRESIYKYHRLGLDLMYDKIETGRAGIIESLELLKKLKREKPNIYFLSQYLSTKSDELIGIFTGATPTEKARVVPILKEIDPANAAKYDKINQAN